ncbi:MAG: hypothetical protein QOE38_2799 [Thermoleophilaceae bacterium]|nr:hypothetical protein [Thermoleophilaceae bacterium]
MQVAEGGKGRRRVLHRVWATLSHKPVEVLVGIAALVVSVAAVDVAIKANDISERQTTIQARQVEPIITARVVQGWEKRKVVSQQVVVLNKGLPATGVDVAAAALLHATFTPVAAGRSVQSVLPVLDYYPVINSTGATTGVLARASGGRNWDAEFHLERAAPRYAARRRVTLSLTFEQDVRVSYSDILGHRHTDYLRVDPVLGPIVLSTREGMAAFAQEDKARAKPPAEQLVLGAATPAQVFRLAQAKHP